MKKDRQGRYCPWQGIASSGDTYKGRTGYNNQGRRRPHHHRPIPQVELRVAEVVSAEKVQGADKLLLAVSLGDEGNCGRIAQYYDPWVCR